MKLHLLKSAIEEFAAYWSEAPEREWIPWENQQHFQEHWDLRASDFAGMYNRSLDSQLSRRLWNREGFEPKQQMLALIRMEPEGMRRHFQELLDETLDIDDRVEHFRLACDELMVQHKEQYPLSVETNHYHEDYQMISLYLAFYYPGQYALYYLPHFRALLEKVESPHIPTHHDFPRFVKVARIVDRFLWENENLVKSHDQNRPDKRFFPGHSLLLVSAFAKWCKA